MTAYMQKHLNLDEVEANKLRVEYWRRYGLTLTGMMRHHNTDPQHFLWETHQFDNLPSMILREPLLRPMLRRLPGKKVIFSNSPMHYTEAVLKILGIEKLFDAVFSLEHMRYLPKPAKQGFLGLLAKYHLDPRTCIMIEDQLRNLKIAKKLGMKTAWVSRSTKMPAYVDVHVRSVLKLPQYVRALMV